MDSKLKRAIEILKNDYPFLNDLSITRFERSEKTYIKDDVLYFTTIPQALVYLMHDLVQTPIELDPHFTTLGTMIDLSRNAVFTVSYMKDVIKRQAMMGINRIMLYMEDVYEVEDEPYFGYMRGRYTKEELQEIVAFADLFEVEIIPCIQTLGHFGQLLRWNYYQPIKDQQTVIMPNTEATFAFVERMIRSLRRMFRTNKIHIGMDEAFGFGLGRYFKRYGFKEPFKLFIEHLHEVNRICQKYGFTEVMMWSDMFFRIHNEDDQYYVPDFEVTESIKSMIPANVSLVYWDYYNYRSELVDRMIQKHLELTPKVIMASGTWIWTKFNYDKRQTDKTALIHIESCRKNGIRDIYFTQWNDDGAPGNYETTFLGVFDMASQVLAGGQFNPQVFNLIMKADYAHYVLYSKINESPAYPVTLLWDDLLNGIYLNNEMIQRPEILSEAIKFFTTYREELTSLSPSFERDHTLKLVDVLKIKTQLRKELLEHYKHSSLLYLIPILEEGIERIEALLDSYREMWLSRYKAFGLDVMQSRLATLQYRFKETIRRIQDLEEGRISQIDELEEKPGPYQTLRQAHNLIAYSSIHVLGY